MTTKSCKPITKAGLCQELVFYNLRSVSAYCLSLNTAAQKRLSGKEVIFVKSNGTTRSESVHWVL